jgi:protein phosphatase
MTAHARTAAAPAFAQGLTVGSRTDVGCVREHNEDSLLVKAPLYVVADGMGGHAAGEVASELAVRTLEEAIVPGMDIEDVQRVVVEANDAILVAAQQGLGRLGMGTTLTAAIIEDDRLLLAQVGDSRAYLLQDGRLRQLTRDHSYVGELVAAGQLTEEEARVHPNRSVITRALGADLDLQPDLYELNLSCGDRLLLCSDGLTAMLEASAVQALLLAHPDPQRAADVLVDAAKEAGGFDNITVIVINVDEVDTQRTVRQKRRFTRGIIAFLVVFVLLVAGTVGGVYAYARNAAFLIDESGYVSLYRGLPGDVLGIELKWRVEQTTIPVGSLNPTTAGELAHGIQTESLDEAKRLIAQYQEQLKKR